MITACNQQEPHLHNFLTDIWPKIFPLIHLDNPCSGIAWTNAAITAENAGKMLPSLVSAVCILHSATWLLPVEFIVDTDEAARFHSKTDWSCDVADIMQLPYSERSRLLSHFIQLTTVCSYLRERTPQKYQALLRKMPLTSSGGNYRHNRRSRCKEHFREVEWGWSKISRMRARTEQKAEPIWRVE